MIKYLLILIPTLYMQTLNAGVLSIFRYEDGHTNWQYVANFSSGVLILLLSSLIIKLFFTHRRAQKANRALKAIRNDLELRVKERTATLNKSNQLLEDEVVLHRETSGQLQASETYIKNILESMPLMLVGLTKEGEITHWNKSAEDMSGITAGDAIGKDLWTVYPMTTITPQQVTKAVEQQAPVIIKHSQRGQYHYDIIIYPLQGQSAPGVVILVDDVSQRILTENMLIQREKMSSMGELASTMAYDINIPLQAIIDDVNAVQHLLTSNDSRESSFDTNKLDQTFSRLADAIKKGQNASAIISNLLVFARSSSEQKYAEDVTEIMEHSLRLAIDVISVPSKLHFRDIRIERDYGKNLPQTPCYRSELQQVFLSLFRHSCHALSTVDRPDQQPVIRVEIKENYDSLWIKIQHNGTGLTLDEQKSIFEPFFNDPSDQNYDPSKRLSFSYFMITEHHKGQMAVTSDTNVGSTFHMQIQLK